MTAMRGIREAVGLAMALAIAPAFAEGPLNVGGPPQSGSFPNGIPNSVEGKPYRWNPANFPLTYSTDLGDLGSKMNAQADTLVDGAFDTWQNVTTASITFSAAGDLGGDVTAGNYLAVEQAILDCSTLPGNPAGGIARPRSIIYDTDGSIIDLAFGVGQSDFTLGFATGTCLTSNGVDNSYNRGYAVMNGKNNPSDLELRAIMIHEFGHMLGLDHSQVNVDCNGVFGCPNGNIEAQGVPTMFPFLMDADHMSTPATDDIAGISALYPETVTDPANDKVPFATTTGRITGRIFFSDDLTQAQSFNVIARRVDNPLTTAVSSVSGFLFTGDNGNPIVPYPGFSPSPNGTRDQNFIGYYEIPGLPPGDYTIEVEAIDSSFTLTSGLGPVGGLGIVFPMPSSACIGEFFDSGEADDDICSDNTSIPVEVNTQTDNIDIILNGTPPRFDAWEVGP